MPTVKPSNSGVDLALRVLDHQIVGSQGELLGNVDNLELREADGVLMVTGVMSGPAALGPRQPGVLGRWTIAIWRRLHPDADPVAMVLPMSHVVRIGSAVEVSAWGSEVLSSSYGFEHWLRRYVVSRIPGATGGEDQLAGQPVGPVLDEHRELAVHADARLCGDLMGAAVLDAGGSQLGRVFEINCQAFERTGLEVGRLRVAALTYGRHNVGSQLGYTAERHQGPALVASLFKLWHRDDRRVLMSDVAAIDWDARTVTLAAGAKPVHPHADP